MEVTKEQHLVIGVTHLQQPLRVMDGRMQQLRRIGPAPVQVGTHVVCTIVPLAHAVRVQHRYDLEYECFS